MELSLTDWVLHLIRWEGSWTEHKITGDKAFLLEEVAVLLADPMTAGIRLAAPVPEGLADPVRNNVLNKMETWGFQEGSTVDPDPIPAGMPDFAMAMSMFYGAGWEQGLNEHT